MKLKIIKTSRWEISRNNVVEFTLDQIVTVPGDVNMQIGMDMLRCDYAVQIDGIPDNSQRTLPVLEQKAIPGSPENKSLNPVSENKLSEAEVIDNAELKNRLEEMTRKELMNYAREKGIAIEQNVSKQDIKNLILKGGK